MKKLSMVLKSFFIILLVAVILFMAISSFLSNPKINTADKLSNLSSETLRDALNYNDKSDSFRKTYLRYANGGMDSIVTINDLNNLPTDLLEDGHFGLYIYNSTSYVPYYGNENIFSTDKKTLFFIHGMGTRGAFSNSKEFFADYNLLAFYWSAFADEGNLKMPLVGDKTWFYDGNLRYYSHSQKKWIENTDINYSVVEMYFAYYYDVISSLSGYDKEITLSGHSYGGMVTYGLISYLTNAIRNGLLGVDVLPDNVTLFDPYLLACENTRHIRWLGNMKNPTNKGGAIILAQQAIYDARILGIAVSLVRSSPIIEYPTQVGLNPQISDTTAIDKFNSQFFYIFGIANEMLDLSNAHIYAHTWSALMTTPRYDGTYSEEYSFSLLNPYHSKFARMGTRYTVNYNRTPENVDDDIITLSNTEIRKIYGFVYVDENGNDVPDERISSHVCGVKVMVKDENGKIVYLEKTSINGYYELPVTYGTYEISIEQNNGSFSAPFTVTVTDQTHFIHASFPIQINETIK